MPNKKPPANFDRTRVILAISLIVLASITGVMLVLRSISYETPKSYGSTITVTGTFECLPHQDAERSTEECALGILSDDGQHYGLGTEPGSTDPIDDAGPYQYFQSGKKARVTGGFQPVADKVYITAGTIYVQTSESL